MNICQNGKFEFQPTYEPRCSTGDQFYSPSSTRNNLNLLIPTVPVYGTQVIVIIEKINNQNNVTRKKLSLRIVSSSPLTVPILPYPTTVFFYRTHRRHVIVQPPLHVAERRREFDLHESQFTIRWTLSDPYALLLLSVRERERVRGMERQSRQALSISTGLLPHLIPKKTGKITTVHQATISFHD